MVFVCAMWRTGFDAPACSTIYLDRPMRNHTLMQAIARANRVFGEKFNGLIVDYVGVFRDMEKALPIYGKGGREVKEGEKGVGNIKVKDGIYEIDVGSLMMQEPVIIAGEEGRYLLSLPSAFKSKKQKKYIDRVKK